MTENKRVSIIVPCYNCADTIQKCVDSLISQTYSNTEIILVDDGSNDSTPDMCDNVADSDPRVRTIHQANMGLVRAWKNGLRIASGEYIMFCDSDDYYDLELVKTVERIATQYSVDIVTYGIKMEYADGSCGYLDNNLDDGLYSGERLRQTKKNLLFSGKMLSQKVLNNRVAKLFRKSLLNQCVDDISDKLTNGEDAVTTYVSVMKCNSLYNIKGYHPYHYVRNAESMIGKYDPEWLSKEWLLRNELTSISDKYGYEHDWQIDNYYFAYIIMFAKKEIGRNDSLHRDVINHIHEIRRNKAVQEVISSVDCSKYSFGSKVFAYLFINEMIFFLFALTKLCISIGVGKP